MINMADSKWNKSTLTAKLKAEKKDFMSWKNISRISSETFQVNDKLKEKIINSQQNIKLGQFTEEKLDIVLKN